MEKYPKYKYLHKRVRCYERSVFVDSTSTYQYVSERNVYKLIKRTCSLNEDYGNRHKCNGKTKFGEPCSLVNFYPHEVPPDSLEFEQQDYLID